MFENQKRDVSPSYRSRVHDYCAFLPSARRNNRTLLFLKFHTLVCRQLAALGAPRSRGNDGAPGTSSGCVYIIILNNVVETFVGYFVSNFFLYI